MKRIVFYDRATPVAYSEDSLTTQANGIGGTEMTVTRIAMKLSEEHHVTVAQGPRRVAEGSGNLSWLPLSACAGEVARADAIVVLRKPIDTLKVRRQNKKASLVLWSHDWYDAAVAEATAKLRVQSQLESEATVLLQSLTGFQLVGCSQVHARNLQGRLAKARAFRRLASRIRVDYVYNPIADSVRRTDAAYDPTKLIFFSSPAKGLDMVLDAFRAVRSEMPDMRLYVASPSYATGADSNATAENDNVTWLGSLSHGDVLDEVRTSLCVFYPANRFAEAGACIFAESHAVGTPVLAHPFGVAPEMLSQDELTNALDIPAVVQRVREWRDDRRPAVSECVGVSLDEVAERWEQVLFRPERMSPSVSATRNENGTDAHRLEEQVTEDAASRR